MISGETILCFAPDPWDDIWRNRHQIMSRLARQNLVIYVEPRPYLRQVWAGLRQGLVRLSQMGSRTRQVMLEMMDRYPRNVLFSPYSAVAHTHDLGLHDLYRCSYPRCNDSTDIGLGRSFRQFRTDLTWDRDAACCVPDTDCADCRHYASGSAVVTARMFRHATNPELFKAWLDYADTYLAVWVMGYDKNPNLSRHLVAPPGHGVL